jgi:peptide/nickel transport system permease protein
MLGETASATDKVALRRSLGFDRPLTAQYRSFLLNLISGDLGRSLYEAASVGAIIRARLPATLQLALCAMLAASLISFPLAMLAAKYRGGWIDRAALTFSLLGLSLPNFWLGPLLMIVFSIQLGWTPVSGRGGLSHLWLPSITLGLGMSAILVRILRASLLQVIHQEYVQTARAKGLPEKQVWLKHVLRNALLSVVTIMSLQFGSLLAGSLITETIFSWPGIGRLTVQAIQTRDYPLVQGCVLVIAISYVLVNFATDLLYKLIDPRVSYGE